MPAAAFGIIAAGQKVGTPKINDPSSPQYGEGMTYGYDVTPEDRYSTGGTTVYATSLFVSGVSPTSEATSTNYGPVFAYRGLAGEVVNSAVT